MVPFIERFPEQGKTECRVATIPKEEQDRTGLPCGQYAFIELYCDKAGCDCQRVLINVIKVSGWEHVATINYGFGPTDAMPGPFLDPINKQSKYSPELLDLFKYILSDPTYVQRLKAHYRRFKESPKHPTNGNNKKGSR
ncbi:MAG: hypothetical protein ABSH12_06040 [Endomicrobiales bacterium]